jgi:nucleoside-diphosphate-sugar epimerase
MQIKGHMTFLIIGAGTFGSRAVKYLRKKAPGVRIVLVDSDPGCLRQWEGRVDTILADGIDFLVRRLNHTEARTVSEWIVPAIPVHVAYEWICLTFDYRLNVESVSVPEALAAQLPNPVRGREGELYVSHATSMCPEDCPEPPDICIATQKPRGTDLYKMLERVMLADYRSVVVRSCQLAPGVGGYRTKALFDAREAVGLAKGRVLVSTACRCHGVVHALRITKT